MNRSGSRGAPSFCGKPTDAVERLIAGPGICICDECIALCNDILGREQTPVGEMQRVDSAPVVVDTV